MGTRVLGLDGCRRGWLGVVLVDGRFKEAHLFATIAEVLGEQPECRVVGVDVPIGLPEDRSREADDKARAFVGSRAASVFSTFPAEVYRATDYKAAADLARRLTGKAITQQGFALRTRIEEAEKLIAQKRLIEVHPEVSFRAMAGRPLAFSKHTWNGICERARLLDEAGVVVPHPVQGSASQAAPDDLLDAAAAAWTAIRFLEGRAGTLPATARRDTTDHPTRGVIWY